MEKYENNSVETKLSEVIKDAYNASVNNLKKVTIDKGGEKVVLTIQETPKEETFTWKVTAAEEIARINAGIEDAVDSFYFNEDNLQRIKYSAYRFLRHNRFYVSVVSAEDLVNQLYVDLRTGLLKLKPYDRAIGRAICKSFEFAVVGGLDEVFIPFRRIGEDV